jgi:hypothetical protein
MWKSCKTFTSNPSSLCWLQNKVLCDHTYTYSNLLNEDLILLFIHWNVSLEYKSPVPHLICLHFYNCKLSHSRDVCFPHIRLHCLCVRVCFHKITTVILTFNIQSIKLFVLHIINVVGCKGVWHYKLHIFISSVQNSYKFVARTFYDCRFLSDRNLTYIFCCFMFIFLLF